MVPSTVWLSEIDEGSPYWNVFPHKIGARVKSATGVDGVVEDAEFSGPKTTPYSVMYHVRTDRGDVLRYFSAELE